MATMKLTAALRGNATRGTARRGTARGTATALAAVLVFAAPAALPAAAAPAALPANAAPAGSRPALPARAVPAAPAAPARSAHARGAGPSGLPAVAQGPIAQTGCTLAGTTATCDLWAMPGTLALPGLATPATIWGFASTSAGPATLPGPVLVVDQGDTVTITVHNGLTSALSLAVPAVTGMAPDTVGAAPGSAKGYTFTASRAGTYLYEAGHTPDGVRQAAMGLFGALVVRAPAVGTAPSAYGDAASVYDDEAVLVLSEVDPAFNAAPSTFDLRSYSPKYRLINGKAYPETDPVATDVGHKVLLRYVDAGLQPHPMTTLGVDQYVLGQDARAKTYPEGAVTLPLQPGQSIDALVTMPSGPDGRRFTLMESGGWLNNAGQRAGTTATSAQAFGGMLTFLDTNPVVNPVDSVGPTASNVVSAPEPASVLAPVTVTANFSDVATGGSNVDSAELVIDDLLVAVGSGIPFTGAFGSPSVTGATATIATSVLTTLTQGRHTLYVRGHDSAGNWGVLSSTAMTLSTTGPVTTGETLTPNPTNGAAAVTVAATGSDVGLGGTVLAAEYFIDATGTSGTGTALTLALPNSTISSASATIAAGTVAALPEGRHAILVHTKDSFGLWGPYSTVDLIVDKTLPTLLSGAAVPPATNGVQGSPSDPTDIRINAAFTDPVSGGVNSAIAGAEGFIDTPGANGAGITFLALDGSFNSATESSYTLIPLTETLGLANGAHQVLVHSRDAAGNWGPLTAVTFIVDRIAPVVVGLAATPTPTAGAAAFTLSATVVETGSGVAVAEWWEGTDPGIGLGHAMTITGNAISTSIATAGLTEGVHTLSVRVRDGGGTWSAVVTTPVNVTRANAIFANAFATNNTSGWSSTVGSPSAATGALVAGPAVGYVADTTPLTERSFFAKFDLTLGTFNPQGAIVDVFQGRGSAGTPVVVVQLRRNGGTTQIRVGILRSNGWVYSAYRNTSGGTIRLSWTSATAGTATLSVAGVNVGTVNGNTSGFTIESAALGVVLRTGTPNPTGALTFDNYSSTRYTAP